jgi:hypothetical protein
MPKSSMTKTKAVATASCGQLAPKTALLSPEDVANAIFPYSRGMHKSIGTTRASLSRCLSTKNGRLYVDLGLDHSLAHMFYEVDGVFLPTTDGFDPKRRTEVYGVQVADPRNPVGTEFALERVPNGSYHWGIDMPSPQNKQDVVAAVNYAHGCLRQARNCIGKDNTGTTPKTCVVIAQASMQEDACPRGDDGSPPAKKATRHQAYKVIAVISLSDAPIVEQGGLTLKNTFVRAYEKKMRICMEALSYAVLLGPCGHSIAKKGVHEVFSELKIHIEDRKLFYAIMAAYNASKCFPWERECISAAGDAVLEACFSKEELDSMTKEARADVTNWYRENVMMRLYAGRMSFPLEH